MKSLKHTQDSLNLTDFAIEHCHSGRWHTYARDKQTLKAVQRAYKLGSIELNEFNQFKLKEL